MVFQFQRDRHLENKWSNQKFNSPMIYLKQASSKAEVDLMTGMRFLGGLSAGEESSFYSSSLCFWPGTFQDSLMLSNTFRVINHTAAWRVPNQ
jgi:hypothetical protein